MTKREFKAYAEQELGYVNYKDLIEELGYNRRNLDRYTYETKLNARFIKKLEEWKSKHNIKKSEEKPKKSKQKEPKKTQIKTNSKQIGVDISNKDYHSSDLLSASKLKLILENPKEYYMKYVTKEIEQKKTDALLIGSLHHTLVQEPHMLEKEYIVLDIGSRPVKSDYVNAIVELCGEVETKQTAKGDTVAVATVAELKEQFEELKGKIDKTIVTQAQLDIAKVTAEKALNSKFIVEFGGKTLFKADLRDLIQHKNSHIEKTFYGEINEVKIQIRPDILMNLSETNEFWYVIDLKTAEEATIQRFTAQSAKYYYDIQEYVYREILRQNGIIVKEFRFNVAGKSDTSDCEFYQLHSEDIENAEKITKKIIDKYKYCKENNIWREGFFDYDKMRFEPTAVVKLPTWRAFEMIKMGVL